MPIYEYRCSQCGYAFEALVSSSQSPAPACPQCGADQPEKQLSTFAATSSSSAPASSGGCCPCGQNPGGCGLN